MSEAAKESSKPKRSKRKPAMEPLGWDEIVSQPGMGGYLSFLNGPVPLPHLQGTDGDKAPVVESTTDPESTPLADSAGGVDAETEGRNVSTPGALTFTGAGLTADPTAPPMAFDDSAPGSAAPTVVVSGTATKIAPVVIEIPGESTSGSITPTAVVSGAGNDTMAVGGAVTTPGAERTAELSSGTETYIGTGDSTTSGAEAQIINPTPGVESVTGDSRDLADPVTGRDTGPGVDTTRENNQNLNSRPNTWGHTSPGAGIRTGALRTPHGLRIRKCFAAQDGHSLGEEVLYQSLWKTAAPEQGGARTIVIGWRGMAQICRMTPKNCKINAHRLIRKLALEVLSPYNTPESIGTTYRVYSAEDIFERRRAAGLEWVVRSKGVEFVDPNTGLAYSAHVGDYASD